MRASLALAVGLACVLLVSSVADQAHAQTPPGAPVIESLTATNTTITVTWSGPEGGPGAGGSYDVQYVESSVGNYDDATIKIGVWSGGTRRYTLTGLADGVSFNVQVRAVDGDNNATEWSSESTVSTSEHGDTVGAATSLALDSFLPGRIDDAADVDHFEIELAARTDLWVYTTGDLDTSGVLTSAGANELRRNDSGWLPPNPRNFSMRAQLDAGTYYVALRGQTGEDTGDYQLHAVTAHPVSIDNPGTIMVGSLTPGRLEGAGAMDRFEFRVTEPTDLWARSIGELDNVAKLYAADGSLITEADDGGVPGMHKAFSLRAQVDEGSYYIEIKGFGSYIVREGPYILYLEAVEETSNSIDDPTPLTLDLPLAGRIDQAGEMDYFSFTVAAATDIILCAINTESKLKTSELAMTLYDPDGADVSIGIINEKSCGAFHLGGASVYSRIRVAAGTHYVEVKFTGSQTGAYMVVAQIDLTTRALEQECQSLGSGQSDPLYGCQWHLNNTGQYGQPGAMEDINVEEVWETTKGAGVVVAVVDSGVDDHHQDLHENLDHSYDPSGFDFLGPLETHGTAVAGIIAARDNDAGVRGVAPRATLFSVRNTFSTLATEAEAMVYRLDDVAVSNNSYGYLDDGQMHYASAAWEMAVEQGVHEGYNGKGIFYVKSAGNGSSSADNGNYDEQANHYAITAVCAVDLLDERARYSELGAHMWVCAPSSGRDVISGKKLASITTTEIYSRYRTDFGGTSAAAPMVSGVAALLRSGYPALTWRDLKLILAGSARQNDTSEHRARTHSEWDEGAFQYGSTEDRYWFNHSYGFGVVDAGAAMALAAGWESPPAWRELSASSNERLTIQNQDTQTSSITLEGPYVDFIEFVAIEIEASHRYYRDLGITLTSPSGETSVLTFSLYLTSEIQTWVRAKPRFGSAKHLGENAAGTWTLSIYNNGYTGPFRLHSWKLTAYGHGHKPGFPAVTGASAVGDAISVTWDAPDDSGSTDISSYDVRYRRSDQASEGDWSEVEDIWSSGTRSYQVDGLDPGGRYELQIRAENEAGAGPWSESREGLTGAVAPDAPAITQVESGNEALRVSWTAPASDGAAEITRYDVRTIATSADEMVDGNWTEVEGIWMLAAGGDLEHTVSGLTTGTQYDVQVRAVNSAGAGDWSGTVTGTPSTVPGQPAVDTVTGARRSLVVAWTAPGDHGGSAISSYDARHIETAATDKSDDQWSAPEVAWTTGDLEHTLSGLEDGTQYDVQVRALSAAGTGLWSESVSGKTLASDDAALIGLRLPGVRLAPVFASDTTAYTATVGYTLDRVTIEATRSDDDATVEYLDVDGVALTDADADTANGFQVDLEVVGDNVIQVRVTADDGTTTQTYSVTVTRVEQDLSLTPTRIDESAPFLSTATYSVRFAGDWTTSVTPDGVPGGAHFSRLIGGVHNAGVRFLESTAAASPRGRGDGRGRGLDGPAGRDRERRAGRGRRLAGRHGLHPSGGPGDPDRRSPQLPSAGHADEHDRAQPRLVRGRLGAAAADHRRSLAAHARAEPLSLGCGHGEWDGLRAHTRRRHPPPSPDPGASAEPVSSPPSGSRA